MFTVEMFGRTFDLDPVAFSLGSFDVYWYGIIIATGFLAALVYCFSRAKEYKINTDPMIDIILLGTIGGILGARAYYVLTSLERYDSFADMIDIRDGGLAIYGGLIGACVFGYLACRWRKVSFVSMLDLVAPCFLIGQAVGRWGNFMNQEAFGSNTTLPWGMFSNGTYTHLSSVQDTLAQQGIMVDPSLPVHPCFLYESLWCVLGFVLLHFLSQKQRFNGRTILHYIIWYGFGRFFIEGVRTDSLMIGSFRISQIVAAACVVLGGAAYVFFYLKSKKEDVEEPLLTEDSSNVQQGEIL